MWRQENTLSITDPVCGTPLITTRFTSQRAINMEFWMCLCICVDCWTNSLTFDDLRRYDDHATPLQWFHQTHKSCATISVAHAFTGKNNVTIAMVVPSVSTLLNGTFIFIQVARLGTETTWWQLIIALGKYFQLYKRISRFLIKNRTLRYVS